jgi:hypothetical protein
MGLPMDLGKLTSAEPNKIPAQPESLAFGFADLIAAVTQQYRYDIGLVPFIPLRNMLFSL